MSDMPVNAEDRIAGPGIGRLVRLLALTGGGILLGIAGLVTTSVLLRMITGAGIDGDFEMVQVGAAIAAFCLFPLCLAIRGNIFVDTFTSRLPARWSAVLDGLWDTLFGLIVLIIAARMVVGSMDQFISKTTLMVIAIPTWWAVALCAGLAGFLGVTALAVGLRMLRGRAAGGQ
jgi:TRAP-type C4-dicarboxylate transport system permease small subunit